MKDLRVICALSAICFLGGPLGTPEYDGTSNGLELVQYVADSTAFNVNSVVIVGETESILIDTQYHVADARRVADQIAATGTRLKAIFITHPDHDHFAGAAVIVERFPGTPVYMTAAAVHHFDSAGVDAFRRDKSRQGDLLADSVVMPQVLPSNHLTVDGDTIEIIPDLQGDVLDPVNSVVWIPSLRTLIASDVVFNGVHVWLGASNEATRTAWRDGLRHLQELRPAVVVAGHKPTVETPDTPTSLQTMSDYLADFDAARETSKDWRELVAATREKYPWKVGLLLNYSARSAFRQR